jgi:hypothetical protein
MRVRSPDTPCENAGWFLPNASPELRLPRQFFRFACSLLYYYYREQINERERIWKWCPSIRLTGLASDVGHKLLPFEGRSL